MLTHAHGWINVKVRMMTPFDQLLIGYRGIAQEAQGHYQGHRQGHRRCFSRGHQQEEDREARGGCLNADTIDHEVMCFNCESRYTILSFPATYSSSLAAYRSDRPPAMLLSVRSRSVPRRPRPRRSRLPEREHPRLLLPSLSPRARLADCRSVASCAACR